jgi:hypothetical protein
MSLVLFCSDPLDPRRPDPDYEAEYSAAGQAGFDRALVSFEALVHAEDPTGAVARVPVQDGTVTGIYRGWMLTPSRYGVLFDALARRGVRLINDAEQYQHCHYLPESYGVIRERTPRTVWTDSGASVDFEILMERLRVFGGAPLVLKDWVKSQKHYWSEACFIPSAADRSAVERAVRRFLELQGPDLAEGLVFREFVPLEPIGIHPRSGMPLTREYRIFCLDGEPIQVYRYWDEAAYPPKEPPVEEFRDVAARVRSRFFTMDIARRADGEWMIVELGDAQAAGLPHASNPSDLYQRLRDRLSGVLK